MRCGRDSDITTNVLLALGAMPMTNPTGESENAPLRLDFDRRLMLEFHGSRMTFDAGLLAFRELDDALGLSQTAGNVLADTRTGRNSHHSFGAAMTRKN